MVGCYDEMACNFNPDVTCTEPGKFDPCVYPDETYLDCEGGCINDVDMDGICDEVDDCIGGS